MPPTLVEMTGFPQARDSGIKKRKFSKLLKRIVNNDWLYVFTNSLPSSTPVNFTNTSFIPNFSASFSACKNGQHNLKIRIKKNFFLKEKYQIKKYINIFCIVVKTSNV